ncbi:uncharacterized protein LOC111797326 [Cucurbita pepo subsp. pepo]|uniref:uncharacterized protein LOC111797326 n=1 Tax=Cucurbita pepo subsp. pepo TaxID=3664 RepID=UPI000C9D7032|nr:uncharacterized protein LOC111797326 [Cucurbita pepo subsp. pepo]
MQLETHELQLNKIFNAYRLRYISNLANDFCNAARAQSRLEKEDRKPEEEHTTATTGVKGHSDSAQQRCSSPAQETTGLSNEHGDRPKEFKSMVGKMHFFLAD